MLCHQPLVEGGEGASTLSGKSDKVGVGDLAMAHDVIHPRLGIGEIVRPEVAPRRVMDSAEQRSGGHRIFAHPDEKSEERSFNNRAQREPTVLSQPGGHSTVVFMIRNDQGDQSIGIQ